jgi:hypothetical protein
VPGLGVPGGVTLDMPGAPITPVLLSAGVPGGAPNGRPPNGSTSFTCDNAGVVAATAVSSANKVEGITRMATPSGTPQGEDGTSSRPWWPASR